MAIPNNVVKVTLVWAPGSEWPSEQAINTFHLQQQSGPSGSVPDVQYIADQVAAKLTTHYGDLAALFPSSIHLAAVKTYLLDTTGHTTAEGAHTFAPTDWVGEGSSGMLPPEVSICLSEYAYLPGSFAPQKGRRRGRMYLPYLSQSGCDVQGKVTSTFRTAITSGFQTLFNDINTIESASGRTDPMGLVVLSKVAGATFEVLHLAVDDHFDAQRRRQHQDTPARTVVDLTAW